MLKKILPIFIIGLVLFIWWAAGSPTGIPFTGSLPDLPDPLQEEVEGRDALTFALASHGYEWRITPKARYTVLARVLSAKRYWFGWQSAICPVDLALGWGEFMDRKVDRWIKWSQHGRWYYYRWKGGSPYGQKEITRHSANTHVIPATPNLKKALVRVRRNHVVCMEGFLIVLEGMKKNAHYTWGSSLSRDDSGDGSCELMYVEKLIWKGNTYR
jgi:hypothetical protein